MASLCALVGASTPYPHNMINKMTTEEWQAYMACKSAEASKQRRVNRLIFLASNTIVASVWYVLLCL